MEQPATVKRILTPTERAAEILFGLIMALTFTCSISIATAQHLEIRQLLIAALSCNLAWGIVDAIMYLTGVLVQKSRDKSMLDAVQNAEAATARQYLADQLPPLISSVIRPEALDQIRMKLTGLPTAVKTNKLTSRNLLEAFALFLLVFLSTFPVALPFIFIHEPRLALRVSNTVAIVMMFLCGWSVARYGGLNKLLMGLGMVGIGLVLVFVTLSLGG
jgi:VIT1/CCC1 family predicted Fe2+/Mn2+ transporter